MLMASIKTKRISMIPKIIKTSPTFKRQGACSRMITAPETQNGVLLTIGETTTAMAVMETLVTKTTAIRAMRET